MVKLVELACRISHNLPASHLAIELALPGFLKRFIFTSARRRMLLVIFL